MALLALALTLGVWFAATRLRGVPPILSAAVALALLVPALGIDPASYARGASPLVALLGPAVVALALPLFRERAGLARRLVPAVAGILAGSAAAIVSAVLVGHALGLSDALVRALAPRAATAPVAASVAAALGGDAHLAAAAAVVGGVLGALLAPLALRFARDPRDAGIGLGTAAHGIGTARAAALDPAASAAAASAMALNALATAVLAPLLVPLLLR